MVKTLRKYNKWILGIGGSLLMVTFLLTGPASILQPDPRDRVLANVKGESVRLRHLDLAEREYEALKSFVPNVILSDFGIETGMHWLLLTTEAKDAGLVGDVADGPDWLPELAQREMVQQYVNQFRNPNIVMQLLSQPGMLQQETDRMLQQLTMARPIAANRARLTDAEFDAALSKLRGTSRLAGLYQRAARVSDRQMIVEFKRLRDRVVVDGVVIPALRTIDTTLTFDDAALQAQYDKFRTVKPGDGENGFGYVLPPRAKLEWMKLDKVMISSSIMLDPVEVNKHWQRNRTTYPGEFAAERQKVEDALRAEKTEEVLAEADRAFKAAVRSATRKLESIDGFKKLPADWDSQRPSMETLAMALMDGVKAGTGVTMPLPRVESRGNSWLTLSALSSLPDVGTARFRIGSRVGILGDLVSQTHELDPKSTLGLQARVPFETPLEDAAGNVYYVCVLDVRGESPPESLAEVREDVLRDLRLLAAFQKLQADLPTYQLLAASDGLEAVAKLFESPTAVPTIPEVFRSLGVARERADGTQPIFDDEDVRGEVMTFADALGVLTEATPANAPQRTLTVTAPRNLSVAVLQIASQDPLVSEDLRLVGVRDITGLQREELATAAPDEAPFSFESLKKRLKYREVGAGGEQSSATPAPAATPATPATAP